MAPYKLIRKCLSSSEIRQIIVFESDTFSGNHRNDKASLTYKFGSTYYLFYRILLTIVCFLN